MANDNDEDDFFDDDLDEDVLAALAAAEEVHASQRAPVATRVPPVQAPAPSQNRAGRPVPQPQGPCPAKAQPPNARPSVPPQGARPPPIRRPVKPVYRDVATTSVDPNELRFLEPSYAKASHTTSRHASPAPTSAAIAELNAYYRTAPKPAGNVRPPAVVALFANAPETGAPPQQQIQQAQQPTVTKGVPPQSASTSTGNADAGAFRQPLPPLQKANGSMQPARGPTDSADARALREQLQQLQQSLEEERKIRMQKEGEVKVLRSNTQKTVKQHEQQLHDEIAKVGPLQERISVLEAMIAREQQKHSSELIFQKQEIESKYRATAAQLKSAKKPASNSQQPRQSQRPASSTQRLPKSQKGFQNSFFESTTANQGVPNLPSSSPSGPRSSPSGRSKGKHRAALISDTDAGDDMNNNNLPDLDMDSGMIDGMTATELQEMNLAEEPVKVTKEDITTFLFDHAGRAGQASVRTIEALVNPVLPQDASPSLTRAHRNACQRLFRCFTLLPSSEDSPTSAETMLLWEILHALVDFVEAFAPAAMRTEVSLALDLAHDLCHQYPSLVYVEEPMEIYEAIDFRIMKAIPKLTAMEENRRKAFDLAVPPAPSAGIIRATDLDPKGKQARSDAAKVVHEKDCERLLLASLRLLQTWAIQAEPTRIRGFEALVRTPSCIAFFVDLRRRAEVHIEAMIFITLLSCRPPLFRTLLSTPFPGAQEPPVVGQAISATQQQPQQLPFVEHIAGFLLYRCEDGVQRQAVQQLALISLCNLVAAHSDGTPLLCRSPSLVQLLILRIAQDACLLYDYTEALSADFDLSLLLQTVQLAMRLLYHLILSQNGLKSLSSHLNERALARDYFIAGVGRIACTEVPDWIVAREHVEQLDQLANVGFELLEEVLSPDEVDEIYALCRDEDEDVEEARAAETAKAPQDEEEQLAAQNVNEMEM